MMLDNPLKIAVLVGVLFLLRVLVGAWKDAPHRVFLVELFNSALIAFALVFLLIRPFLLQAFYIPSGSMEPTLYGDEGQMGDRILVNKFIYRLGPPRRGDIAVFRAPQQAFYNDSSGLNGNKDYIKRVIGLPGDLIQIKSGDGVYLNGERLVEPYLVEPPYYNWPGDDFGNLMEEPYEVPEGHIVVLGDNRNHSNDSHLWRDPMTGKPEPALSMDNLLGRSLIIFWPPRRIGHLTQ